MELRGLCCGVGASEVPVQSTPVPAKIVDSAPSAALWVATDLSTWAPKRPETIARDCQIDDVMYRRLDPQYFAWLRARMFVVKAAFEAGKISPDAYDELSTRFNAVQQQAIALFGESALLAVAGQFDPESYRPPLPEPEERPRAAEPVPARRSPDADRIERARRLVDAIRDQALALGWTTESLYFSDGFERRPFAAQYSLICYIHAQDRIGAVTSESIEIVGPPPLEVISRFYNTGVNQPWYRPAATIANAAQRELTR